MEHLLTEAQPAGGSAWFTPEENQAVREAADALERNRPAELGLLLTVGPWVVGLLTDGWGRYSGFAWIITSVGFVLSLVGFSLSKHLPRRRGRAMSVVGISAWSAPVALILFAAVMLASLVR